ncbi:hypothetical protein HNQ91_001645 [Filimonas zeae]|uniref:Adhesin domain-containing protein n=1 Tax=Filimonas zeae TaxID=1737353 RepID=A0A917IXY8_9BACT|nr:hypothetical protein [Filimonas zeae]MDR6338594.1 hypothetical protein [Filimonas zeae]GGH67492.1 hypothetical protein GCM10011379_22830 [Filimonas zeae]
MKYFIIPVFILALHITGYAQEKEGKGRLTTKDSALAAERKKQATEPENEKTISVETDLENGLDLLLESDRRTVEIKTWDKPKVKISTTVVYRGESSLSDEAWFEKLNISWKKFGGSFRIISKSIVSFEGYGSGNFAVFEGDGKAARLVNKKRILTIYVPQQLKVEADIRNGELSLSGKVASLKLVSSNANISAGDVDRLIMRSQHDNVSLLSVKDGEIEINNSRVSIKNADELDIDSKYTNIEILTVNKATIRSSNDEYDIDNARTVRGRKNYGTLRIGTLLNSIDMEGANADIKIRHFDAGATLVKLNNKYADLRLPASDIKNYSVKMEGSYNNVYASFEKTPLPVSDTLPSTAKNKPARSATIGAVPPTPPTPPTPAVAPTPPNPATTYYYTDSVTVSNGNVNINTEWVNEKVERALKTAEQVQVRSLSVRRNDSNTNFTAKVGDGSGLRFELRCTYCTVDFK